MHHAEGDPGDEAGGEGDAGGHQQVPQVRLRVGSRDQLSTNHSPPGCPGG